MRFLLILLLVVILAGPASAETRLARVTVYWGDTRGSTGVRLKPGHCAVDPRRIPYRSRVVMGKDTLVAVDTGSAVKTRLAARRSGRTPSQRAAIVVDRYFVTRAQAMAWVARNPLFSLVTIYPPVRG